MKPIARLLLVGMILTLLLSACSPVNYNLYGTWSDAQTGTTFEFLHNGHFRFTIQGSMAEFPFTFTSANVYSFPFPDSAGEGLTDQAQPFTVEGDTLTLQGGIMAQLYGTDPIVMTRIK
jgi:hypothetical protein